MRLLPPLGRGGAALALAAAAARSLAASRIFFLEFWLNFLSWSRIWDVDRQVGTVSMGRGAGGRVS